MRTMMLDSDFRVLIDLANKEWAVHRQDEHTDCLVSGDQCSPTAVVKVASARWRYLRNKGWLSQSDESGLIYVSDKGWEAMDKKAEEIEVSLKAQSEAVGVV